MADFELTPVLIAQAWQVTLLIVAVAAINRWVGKSRPHLAHALWLVVLVKCVTPPIWSSPSGLFCWLQPAHEAIREPLAIEPPSQSWSDLLEETRKLEPVDVIYRRHSRESSDVVIEAAAEDTELSRVRLPAVVEVASAAPPNNVNWPNVLLGAWISASLGVLGVAIVRWLQCWRMVRSAPQRDCAELSAQLDALAKQLRLRRRVRLIVTESRLGPAVIGLFRTTVLLPALIVDRLLANADSSTPRQSVRSASSVFSRHGENTDDADVTDHGGQMPLAPILAHELLHIRRGDLWVGLLQTVAQALWWCHPLVWWVSRRTTREAEHCCDEEVLAELGCDPAAYARALVDVLELKRELKPVPVFPGVRPVEVTSQRLERIMQLGQGCQRRTPWWCWLLAGLAAAATWPGAAFVVTADDAKETGERGGVSPPVISPPSQNRGANAAPLANASDGAIYLRKEPQVGLVYQVRVISGSEEEVRQLAGTINEKLIAKSGTPVVVANDEIQRLLKEAQGVARLNTTSHPIATSRGGESAIVGDTARFTVPVEVTPGEETAQYFETSREYGWRLTMQPLSVGESLLRLRVVNWQGRLDDDSAVKVRYRTTGEEKLIPGLTERQTSTTIELKDGQYIVFPVTAVPTAKSPEVMLLVMQVRQRFLGKVPLWPEPTPSARPAVVVGAGVNSNSGITRAVVDESWPEPPKVLAQQPIIAPPIPRSKRQIVLSLNIYEANEDVLKNLGLQPRRTKRVAGDEYSQSQVQVHDDQDVIAKLTAMEREKKIRAISSPTITTTDGSTASFLSGVEFAVPTVVGVDESKKTETTFRGFGLQLTAKPIILGPDLVRVSVTLSDSKLANEKDIGVLTGVPTLVSQSIQAEVLAKPKEPVFFGPFGEPSEKGTRLIATLSAKIVEPKKETTANEQQPLPAVRLIGRPDVHFLNAVPMGVAPRTEKLVTINFDNVPLKEAIKQLAQSASRNIVLDKAGLEDESLTECAPVTLAVDQVKLSSALKLMLDPLNLGYRVEESGVIVVTSQQRLKGQAVVVTYSVADLTIPIPKRVAVKLTTDQSVGGGVSKPSDSAKLFPAQIPELVKLITSTCQPNSWEAVGGNGQIKANDATLSLVVRQTPDVHAEIRDLLEQLRRLHDLQAALQVETLTVPADFWHKVGKDFDDPEADGRPIPQPQDKSAPRSIARLTKKEAALLRSLSQPESAPKVTLFNGQELEVYFGGESPTMRLGLKPVVSADHQMLRLQAAATKPDAELDFTKLAALTLKSGDSLLLDVTEVDAVGLTAGGPIPRKVPYIERVFQNKGKSDRHLLLITGTVVIVEEE